VCLPTFFSPQSVRPHGFVHLQRSIWNHAWNRPDRPAVFNLYTAITFCSVITQHEVLYKYIIEHGPNKATTWFRGVVGYHVSLTHWRSPVRTRAKPSFFIYHLVHFVVHLKIQAGAVASVLGGSHEVNLCLVQGSVNSLVKLSKREKTWKVVRENVVRMLVYVIYLALNKRNQGYINRSCFSRAVPMPTPYHGS
jgi:hypothetical protein